MRYSSSPECQSLLLGLTKFVEDNRYAQNPDSKRFREELKRIATRCYHRNLEYLEIKYDTFLLYCKDEEKLGLLQGSMTAEDCQNTLPLTWTLTRLKETLNWGNYLNYQLYHFKKEIAYKLNL